MAITKHHVGEERVFFFYLHYSDQQSIEICLVWFMTCIYMTNMKIWFCFQSEMAPKAHIGAKVSSKILVLNAAVFRGEHFQREMDPKGSNLINRLAH